MRHSINTLFFLALWGMAHSDEHRAPAALRVRKVESSKLEVSRAAEGSDPKEMTPVKPPNDNATPGETNSGPSDRAKSALAGGNVLVSATQAVVNPSFQSVGNLMMQAANIAPLLTYLIPPPAGLVAGVVLSMGGGLLQSIGIIKNGEPPSIGDVLNAMQAGFNQMNEKLGTIIDLQSATHEMTQQILVMVKALYEDLVLDQDVRTDINNAYETAIELFSEYTQDENEASLLQLQDTLPRIRKELYSETRGSGALSPSKLNEVLSYFIKQSVSGKDYTYCNAALQVHWFVATRQQFHWMLMTDAVLNEEDEDIKLQKFKNYLEDLAGDLEMYDQEVRSWGDLLLKAVEVDWDTCNRDLIGINCNNGEWDAEAKKCQCSTLHTVNSLREGGARAAPIVDGLIKPFDEGYQGALYRDCDFLSFSCDLYKFNLNMYTYEGQKGAKVEKIWFNKNSGFAWDHHLCTKKPNPGAHWGVEVEASPWSIKLHPTENGKVSICFWDDPPHAKPQTECLGVEDDDDVEFYHKEVPAWTIEPRNEYPGDLWVYLKAENDQYLAQDNNDRHNCATKTTKNNRNLYRFSLATDGTSCAPKVQEMLPSSNFPTNGELLMELNVTQSAAP